MTNILQSFAQQQTWLRWAAVAIPYTLSGLLGLRFAVLPGEITAVWIPAGIALAAVLVWGKQIWPGIFIGSFAISLIHYDVTPSVLITGFASTLGNILTAVVGVSLIQRFAHTRYPFNQAWAVFVFVVFGAILSQLISATIGITALCLSQSAPWSIFGFAFLTWWISNSAGVLIVTPTLLTWYSFFCHASAHKSSINIRRMSREIAVWLVLMIIVIDLAFWNNFSVEYLILTLLIWSVFRFPKHWTTLAIMLTNLMAILGTAQGNSIFFREEINQSLLFLNSFIGVVSITTLFLMAILEERSQALKELKQAKNELEVRVIERTRELSEANEKLQKLSTTDSLTGCFNRLKIEEFLEHHMALYARHKQVFSIILCDIDYFKQVNDRYGHLVGDAILIGMVKLFQERLRNTDVLGRWGGEEFVVICPNTDLEGTKILAEILRERLATHWFEQVGYQTASFGVAECGECHKSQSDLVRQADEALYQAKARGRNCTIGWSSRAIDPKVGT